LKRLADNAKNKQDQYEQDPSGYCAIDKIPEANNSIKQINHGRLTDTRSGSFYENFDPNKTFMNKTERISFLKGQCMQKKLLETDEEFDKRKRFIESLNL
jgi:hypothetical protein